jgi:hypothetical protein
VPEHHEQDGSDLDGAVFQTAHDERRVDRVPCHPHVEQVSQALVEDHFGDHPGVGAPQHDREGLLTVRDLDPADAVPSRVLDLALHEPTVPGEEPFQRLVRGLGTLIVSEGERGVRPDQ